MQTARQRSATGAARLFSSNTSPSVWVPSWGRNVAWNSSHSRILNRRASSIGSAPTSRGILCNGTTSRCTSLSRREVHKLMERSIAMQASSSQRHEEVGAGERNLLYMLSAFVLGVVGVDCLVIHADGNNPGLKKIIPTFAKVQDTLANVGYREADSFPQIVVLGVQSSGKSSILEMIVGEEFIPKGEGTVTKRPLILTLHNTTTDPAIKDKTAKWGEFPDFPRMGKVTNFKTIENFIRDQNKQLSREPLRLEIYSPDVVDLRLVDLPGLIHNPTRDQPEDMRERIKNLCGEYIENKKTVVLAISPGNQDLQTSEALRLARKSDPKGRRTISVLSKLDLVDKNDFIALIDTIQKLPLRLGYVGVVSRNKQQLQKGVTISEALQLEEEFFKFHPQFQEQGIKVGTMGLAKELSTMLEAQLHNSLPVILEKLRTDLRKAKKDREVVGLKTPANPKERDQLLLQEVSRFLRDLLGASTVHEIKTEIAARIYKAISAECMKALNTEEDKASFGFWRKKSADDGPKYWEGQEDVEYRRWRDKIHALVQKLSPLSENLTHQVVDMLRARVPQSSEKLSHRPFLQETIANATMKYLNQSYDSTVDNVKYLIKLENNISYEPEKLEGEVLRMKTERNIDQEKEKAKSTSWLPFTSGGKETKGATITKYDPLWTEAYLKYMAERLSNNIYNAFCVEIFDKLEEQLRDLYVVELYGNDPARRDMLLKETPEIETKRKELDAKIAGLESAISTLGPLVMRQ